MSIGVLYLESISSGVITNGELAWIAKHQLDFSRCEQVAAMKIGRLIDNGQIHLGCRL